MTSDQPEFAGPCPRCGGGVPNDLQPGAYPGALSRLDNRTYICSDCGQAEALYQWLVDRDLPPINEPIRFPAGSPQ